jgi:putative sporulation protein YtaF
MFFGILALAFAISADGFLAGLAYGMGGIKIPAASRFIIAFAASAMLAVSMALGDALNRLLPAYLHEYLAIIILLGIGIYLIFQGQKKPAKKDVAYGTVWQLSLPALGLIIQILRHPAEVDQNEDRSIAAGEALLLGLALSLDSLGIGFGVAMGGFPIGPTVLCAGLCKFILLSIALKLGVCLSAWGKNISKKAENLTPYIPALVILALALIKIVTLVGGML